MNQPEDLKKRGGLRNGAGRREIPPEERRVKLTVWILPSTRAKLPARKPGHVIDLLVL